MKKLMLFCLVVFGVVCASTLCLAAETNILSFAYTASLAADASTPDPWLRKLNDGYWTNSVSDGVKYVGDVTVTLDLSRRTRLSKVDVRTFTVGGGAPLETQGVTLACGDDGTTWSKMMSFSPLGNGLFSISPVSVATRYLRLTCTQGDGASGQSLAEIVVSGMSASPYGLLDFTYESSIPPNLVHPDNATNSKLKDGYYANATSQSIQYGVSNTGSLDGSTTNCIATNVVIVTTLSGVKTLRRAHLYAYNSASSYGTYRVTLSNSLDGLNWSCAGQQTVYESLPNVCARFDFILPNVEAQYLAFACEKPVSTSYVRQLLAEIQIVETVPALGEPAPFTYAVNMASSTSHDNSQCPKLTDGTWESNTRNALRYYGDPVITADLGAPMYVAGTDLLCWSNSFQSGVGTYSTGRVVVYGGIDTNTWTQLAEITTWKPSFPYNHAVIFRNPPYARYLRFDTFRCEDTEAVTNTAQILGELVIYRPPSAVIGAEPVEVPGAIPFAGFETDPLLPDATLVKGGETNGWTFSFADAANYAGYQINRSPVSTNTSTTHYYAPQGVQTAVLMGSGNMEAQISVPTNGTYELQMRVNSTVYGASENGGYDFRVKLDGVSKGSVAVLQLTNTMHQVLLPNVAAGAHTLRFEGVNAKSVTWGALIDDLKLMRYEVDAAQVAEQGGGFVFVADSRTPLALDYVGTLTVKDLWLNGVLMPPGKYWEGNATAIFEGPGAIGFDRGTFMTVR